MLYGLWILSGHNKFVPLVLTDLQQDPKICMFLHEKQHINRLKGLDELQCLLSAISHFFSRYAFKECS